MPLGAYHKEYIDLEEGPIVPHFGSTYALPILSLNPIDRFGRGISDYYTIWLDLTRQGSPTLTTRIGRGYNIKLYTIIDNELVISGTPNSARITPLQS